MLIYRGNAIYVHTDCEQVYDRIRADEDFNEPKEFKKLQKEMDEFDKLFNKSGLSDESDLYSVCFEVVNRNTNGIKIVSFSKCFGIRWNNFYYNDFD